ncbi:MAG: ribonuclease HIII [Tuberibacillus sp.]
MGQSVLTVKNAIIEKMKAFYIDHLTDRLPPGAVFRATPDDCSVTAYRSGKVLFQGKRAEEEALIWEKWSDSRSVGSSKKDNAEKHEYLPPKNIGDLAIIGSDEVGTGDYFGPIVVCAAYVDASLGKRLEHLGIRDSKALTDTKITAIAQEISRVVPYSLLTLPNEKYNRLVDKGYTQTKLKAVLHNQALLNVIKKLDGTPFDGCLVDQFTPPAQYFKAISDRPEKTASIAPIFFKTKAESLHIAVASASVIARYAFLRAMDRLSAESGMELPKGAGAGVDHAAAELMRMKGDTYLHQVAKVHFANTEKAKKLL